MTGKLILYAPNIHTGGGYILLRSLLDEWPTSLMLTAVLDLRAKDRLCLPVGSHVHWVKPSVISRLKAEVMLRDLSKKPDTVLCFHGLPPILPSFARVLVFHQNRNYLGLNPLRDFPLRTAARLGFERLIGRVFRGRVSEYLVQTPSMARDLTLWYRRCSGSASLPTIRVRPFLNKLPTRDELGCSSGNVDWDFVYIADGVAHKNHRRLLEAWCILASNNIRPKLALTLGSRDELLIQAIVALRTEYKVEIFNLGEISHNAVIAVYKSSRALIFPSLSESFGLPLIEASHFGLPIIASELDYVREVCDPVETFNPNSPHSIALAVMRFLNINNSTFKPVGPSEFLAELVTVHE